MKCPSCSYSQVRKKAVWGRSVSIALVAALLAVFSSPAEAQLRSLKLVNKVAAKASRPHHKLDKELNRLADSNGETDVIVEFHDDSDSASRIRNHGGVAGKKLSLFRARCGVVPHSMMSSIANDPQVKRVHLDREAHGEMARTSATVGALTARLQYGYSGAGVGIAVIDSGIANWHDDLGASASSKTGQRVTAFVDFVNNQTSKYDDWGHGTHVAGIIAGSGYHSYGARAGIAPRANIVALKALDSEGKGRISNIIAALDWVLTNRVQYNIRVVNMSLGAGVYESYHTDPLTVAAKRVVDAGVVVVAAAGNMGKALNGQPQYGAISAPGNAPWVLTVGASTTEGTVDRRDDKMALFSSRGPTMIDFAAKPDLVAPGAGTVSLATQNSLFFLTKTSYLVSSLRVGSLLSGSLLSPMQYLTLSGTSMATPVVAGSVALMLEANPNLTPNMVKAILQFTSEVKPGYDFLTQGAGFLNTLGAVRLSRYFATAQKGDAYPDMRAWSKHILWGNKRVRGGVITPGGTAWALNIVWGDAVTPGGQNIVWGENCDTAACDNIVRGSNIVWGEVLEFDNIVWGNTDGDNVVWGDSFLQNIVWGNNIVWGDSFLANIVWGNDCGGADCANVVWGSSVDNMVWGNAEGLDNIVWGDTSLFENIVWGNTTGDQDISWGSSADQDALFADDTAEVETFNPDLFDDLFDVAPIVNPAPTGSGSGDSEGGLQ